MCHANRGDPGVVDHTAGDTRTLDESAEDIEEARSLTNQPV